MNDIRPLIRVRHILLQDEEDASYILEKLEQGESFEELAREFSECESAERGGLLSYRSGQMVAEFERAVYQLKDGELSKPIKTEFGFHLILKE